MQRVRIGIIGTGTSVEWAILPALSGSDALSPPDTGAWWSRRPAPSGDIRYQAPAQPEIVALCAPPLDEKAPRIAPKTSPRLEMLSRAARGAALYEHPQFLLGEMALDALLIAASDDEDWLPAPLAQLAASAPGAKNGIAPPRWIWIDGPPARNLGDLGAFARAAMGHGPNLWIAAPLKRAAAHRAARRLLERDGIGEVTAIQARFPFPLDAARFGAAYAAFDLILSFVGGGAGMPQCVTAHRHPDGAASLLLKLSGGATISVLFGAADAWNAPLPRLEICGTQGRFLVCEAGRRLWHHVPREGARLWEPPGLAAHVSASNLSGYAEDLKAFLAVCVNNPAPFNAERALDDAARALGALEATLLALESGAMQAVEARGPQNLAKEIPATQSAPPRNLTLELG
jgi:predicted dehydrogenase